jgi:hypothetical protein
MKPMKVYDVYIVETLMPIEDFRVLVRVAGSRGSHYVGSYTKKRGDWCSPDGEGTPFAFHHVQKHV